jgi:hypothetical protein
MITVSPKDLEMHKLFRKKTCFLVHLDIFDNRHKCMKVVANILSLASINKFPNLQKNSLIVRHYTTKCKINHKAIRHVSFWQHIEA